MLHCEILQLVDGWQQVEGCIDWSGPVDAKGYGRVTLGGYRVYVHRLVFSRTILDVLDRPDVAVMHLCDNPACINPAHLVAGSANANMFDMKRKARSAHGSNHPASMLTATQLAEIFALAYQGEKHKDIARRFGVSRSTISKVLSRSTYQRESVLS